jgi:large subunit ribosomal protein L25
MTDDNTLRAEGRVSAGKGGARACRRADRIPAVIYGGQQPSSPISIASAELQRHLRRPGFFSHVYAIERDGSRERVLPREVQYDPVTDRPIHVDFQRVVGETRVNVDVPVVFVNEAAATGLRTGGVLNVVRHTVELVCTPDAIPERIEVDLTGLEIGDVIHAEQLRLPAGVALAAADREATIVTVVPPQTEPVAGPEAEAGAAAPSPGT